MENSSFSCLPPELRNEIYHLTLIEETPVRINTYNRRVWKPSSLLQTCRQIRTEASPVYFGCNAFVSAKQFYSVPLSLRSWCRMVGTEARAQIHTIHMSLDYTCKTEKNAQEDSRCDKDWMKDNGADVPRAKLWFAYWGTDGIPLVKQWACVQ